MKNLPPLTKVLDKGSEAGFEFERLMKALLTNDSFLRGYVFEPGATYRDKGIDGIVKMGYPEMDCPVVFQFKWLEGPINKGAAKQQIKKSFESLVRSGEKFNSYVLVTPNDLSSAEKEWLEKLPTKFKEVQCKIFHYGHTHIQVLMDKYPAVKKYYYGEQVPGVPQNFKVIEKKYKEAIIEEFQLLDFIGLPPNIYEGQKELTRPELAEIYIPLNFTFGKNTSKTITLHEILKKSDREKQVVILGEAGSGKSTLAKYLALIHSQKSGNDNKLEIVEGKTPFFISIRDFARKRRKNAQSFNFIDYLKYIADENYNFNNIDKDFFEAQLALEKAVVFFDGLDEVAPESGRKRISSDIQQFSREYPGNYMWVMSRIGEYTINVRLKSEQFKHYNLAPVSPEQANTFIKKWYEIQDSKNENPRFDGTSFLQSDLEENPGVRSLKTNPLLLTMMCLVYRSKGSLPENRARLYEKCIELILKTWQEQRYKTSGHSNPLAERGLQYRHQVKLLAAVAFYIQKKNQDKTNEDTLGLVKRKELQKVLSDKWRSNKQIPGAEAKDDFKDFIEYCRKAGLLIEKKGNEEEEDVFEFAHLSFLEYLCACQIVENKSKVSQETYINELLAYLEDPAWEEPLLLSLSLFNIAKDSTLINAFTKAVFKKFKSLRHFNVWFLMGRAIRDNVDFTDKNIKQITAKIVKLWLKRDESHTAFSILKEIVQSSKKGKDIIKKVINIKENIKNNPPDKAFEWLYLYKNLYGIDSSIPGIITSNKNYCHLLSYLLVYKDREALSEFLDNEVSGNNWLIYYNSVTDKTSENLDRLLKSQLNPFELKVYLISSWLKIFTTFNNRVHFPGPNKSRSNPDEIGCEFGVYAWINFPLTLYRPFCERIESTIPESISNERFLSEDRENNIQLRAKYLADWLSNNVMDFLKKFEASFPNSQMSPEEIRHLKKKIEEFSQDFSQNFSLDLSQFLPLVSREKISLDFSKYSNLYKDINLWLNRDFNHYFKKYFYQEFSQYFSRYSASDFNRFLSLDLDRGDIDYSHQEFINYIADLFYERYEEKLNWDNLTEENIQRVCNLFVEEFQSGDIEFFDKFLNHLYMYLFYSEFSVSSNPVNNSSQSFPGKKNAVVSTSFPPISMKTPLVIPFTFNFVLTASLTHYVINLLVELNNISQIRRKIKQSIISKTINDFTRKKPFWLYLISFSWNFYSKDFNENYKNLRDSEEKSLALAAFVVNAAKVSLVAGMPCKGKEWEKIIKKAKKSPHAFVQISLTLYKLCNFIDQENNSELLKKQLDEFKQNYPDYYKLIGFQEK